MIDEVALEEEFAKVELRRATLGRLLGYFAPYTRQVASHLKNRFRIDQLWHDGTREVIVNTALDGSREFPAADRLQPG